MPSTHRACDHDRRQLTRIARAAAGGVLVKVVLAVALLLSACATHAVQPQDDAHAAAAANAQVRDLADRRAIPPAMLPAFDALARAVTEGDDRSARGILRGILARAPSGRALELARSFERILDGRECIAALAMRLECRSEPAPTSAEAGAADGATVVLARLYFVVESSLSETLELRPGPATLIVTRTSVDARGGEQRSIETHSFVTLKALHVSASQPSELELAQFFLTAPEGTPATRLQFALDLRSGVVERKGSELPAQHMRVAAAEASCLSPSLASLPQADAVELCDSVADGKLELAHALAIAVRIVPAERALTLDQLTPHVLELSEPALRRLVPSLRWLAPEADVGGDPEGWRAWMRARELHREAGAERPRLQLPPEGSSRAIAPQAVASAG